MDALTFPHQALRDRTHVPDLARHAFFTSIKAAIQNRPGAETRIAGVIDLGIP